MDKQSIQPNPAIPLTLNGSKRKEAANCIGTALGITPVYQKAPSYAYTIGTGIGTAVIDRSGNLTLADEANEETRHAVLAALQAAGFLPELVEAKIAEATPQPSQPEAPDRLTIQMPMSGFSPEKLDNLCKLVSSKQTLLQQAIGAEDQNGLPVAISGETISFPWFRVNATPEEITAYTQLVARLCDMAKQQQRILATDNPDVENPKYTFRCFLLRLGFIGEEYAETRKILLQNLSGNGSHKSGTGKPRQPKVKEPAEKVRTKGRKRIKNMI
jgi:hypothetical protein